MPALLSLSAAKAAANPQNWPVSVYVLLVSLTAYALGRLVRRPAFPGKAPRVFASWPVVGALDFFSRRAEFLEGMRAASRTGQYSFHFGKHRIVGLSGEDGRRTFFESKELNIGAGYATLFHGAPEVRSTPNAQESRFDEESFKKHFVRMMRREKLVANLSAMVADTRAALDVLAAKPVPVVDAFDDLWALVFQLTTRTVAANEIAEDPALMRRTLSLFEDMDRATGDPAKIIFPWLPTVGHIRRMWSGTRLYMLINNLVETRKKEGRREEDALQALMDGGASILEIVSQIVGALFAGLINSGINAGWLLCYLAANPEWYARAQGEIDAAIARHRATADEDPMTTLARLSLEDWEVEFPVLDLALRETIRLTQTGCAFRKNTSGRDLPIGKSGEVIPADAFAIYHMDDTMMDTAIYSNPLDWDPSRYLPERAEDKKLASHGYIGWGSGRHPCLGMRFAKLEMNVMTVAFLAMFDFHLSDKDGNETSELSSIDRNRHSASKPEPTMHLRYKLRVPKE